MELETIIIVGLTSSAPIVGAYTSARMLRDFREGKDTLFSRACYYFFVKKDVIQGLTFREILRENELEFYGQSLKKIFK